MRTVLALLAGFVLWTVLWLGSNAAVAALIPTAFAADGSASAPGVLVLFLGLSIAVSMLAGYAAARLAPETAQRPALWLGVLLLAVGLFVQVQYWDVMPLWYHLAFLLALVPATVFGGRRPPRRAPTLAKA